VELDGDGEGVRDEDVADDDVENLRGEGMGIDNICRS